LAAAVLAAALAGTPEPRLQIEFTAEEPRFEEAAAEYRALWREDGVRVVAEMEKATGLMFEPGPVRAIVYEGISMSGFKERPMRLRASYPRDSKRATLVHELGHRLQGHLFRKGEEDHPTLFLYLYDVWVRLYGKEFADAQVAVEGGRTGYYDYEGAWKQALSLSPEARAARLKAELGERVARRLERPAS
jgi:hypothetical protein